MRKKHGRIDGSTQQRTRQKKLKQRRDWPAGDSRVAMQGGERSDYEN